MLKFAFQVPVLHLESTEKQVLKCRACGLAGYMKCMKYRQALLTAQDREAGGA